MSPDKIEEFQIHHGDTMVPPVNRKSDLGDILRGDDEATNNDKTSMNCLLNNNPCVRLVDIVSV